MSANDVGMPFQFVEPGYSLQIDRDYIDVTMAWTATANEGWRFTDKAGHNHHWEHGYPTLDHIIDAEHWCDGSEGFMHHDPHMVVDESHYECKLCREVIEPTIDPPGTRKSVPGAVRAVLTIDGRDIEVTESDVREIVEAYESEDRGLSVALSVAQRYA